MNLRFLYALVLILAILVSAILLVANGVAYEYKIGTSKEIHPHAFHLLVDSIVRRVEMVVTKRDRSVASLRARGQDSAGAEAIIVKLEDNSTVRVVFHSSSSEEREDFIQAVTRSLADMGIEAKSAGV
jgi:hypothetical protein